jgi:hypothetical protein
MTSINENEFGPIDWLARAVMRAGLGLVGGMNGLFVAAFVARTDAGVFDSAEGLLAAVAYGGIGFALGVDLPALKLGPTRSVTNAMRLVTAAGTLIAAAAALVAICAIILDAGREGSMALAVGVPWTVGVAMQACAGFGWRRMRAWRPDEPLGVTSGEIQTHFGNVAGSVTTGTPSTAPGEFWRGATANRQRSEPTETV